MAHPPEYEHTQRAPLFWVLLALAAIPAAAAWGIDAPAIRWTLWATAALVAILALCFMHLTIRDEGDRLAVRYGPLPLFKKRFRYDRIRRVEIGRTSWIDGWGIHWMPGRGWTYNLWGFDCVRLKVAGRSYSLGTDDAQGLAEFLRRRISRTVCEPSCGRS